MADTLQGSATLFFSLLYFSSSCHFFSLPYHYYSCAETSVSPRRSRKYPPLVPLGTNMSRQFILHWVKKGMPVRGRVPASLPVCFSIHSTNTREVLRKHVATISHSWCSSVPVFRFHQYLCRIFTKKYAFKEI